MAYTILNLFSTVEKNNEFCKSNLNLNHSSVSKTRLKFQWETIREYTDRSQPWSDIRERKLIFSSFSHITYMNETGTNININTRLEMEVTMDTGLA